MVKRILFFCLLLYMVSAAPAHAATRIAPVAGAIVTDFDVAEHDWLPGHRGIDLAATPGTPVHAPDDGVVKWVGTINGVAMMSVNHADGTHTTYQPVVATVRASDRVRAGQVIATVTSGHDCDCLHFGVKRGADYLDPRMWLGIVSHDVRLLPMDAEVSALPPPGWGQTNASGLPVPGPITSGYGYRTNPISGRSEFHDGVDIGAPCGTAVTIRTDGVVTRAANQGGFGLRIEVDHGDHTSSYSHLSTAAVTVGARVNAGDVIGAVGTTGYSTGCHLHWSIHAHGTTVDPLIF